MSRELRFVVVNPAESPDEQRMRPSAIFGRRVRERRVAHRASLETVAQAMTDVGQPLGKASLLRTERGDRCPSLDEALALAFVLDAVPEQLLAPAGDELVWLTGYFAADSEALREWLRHGIATPEARKANLADSAARLLERHAQALSDALRSNDVAGRNEALVALGRTALAFRSAIEQVER
jgi:transcriptional regulator with XRE-family HTH domain